MEVEASDGGGLMRVIPPLPLPEELEITPEMIEAGALVLVNSPFCGNISPGFAETVAAHVLREAFAVASRGTPSFARSEVSSGKDGVPNPSISAV